MKKIFVLIGLFCFIFHSKSQTPNAVNDSVWVSPMGNVVVNPLLNDTFDNSLPIIFTIIKQGTNVNGTINTTTNQMTLTTLADFSTEDTIEYRICNILGVCDTAFIFLNVGLRANDDAEVELHQDSLAMYLDVLANDQNLTDSTAYIQSVLSTTNYSTKIVNGKILIERNLDGSCGKDTFSYKICAGALCDTALVAVNIKCNVLGFLPTGFSPNGDGFNDKLVFPYLDNSKPVSLTVMNRYGDIVYENQDYGNDWDGIARDHKKPLPDGSYWYIVRAKGRKNIQYLVLQR